MKRHLPSLNALRTFEAAGRLGRMTAAAEELCVTHGAISRQIRQLEEELGIALFEGTRQKPVLTAAGESLLQVLTSALDQIETAIRSVVDEETGILDVSCLGTFLIRWLIPRLHRFTVLHPEIEVRMRAADGPVDLDRERYDAIITVDDGSVPEHVRVVQLFPERLGPVVAPALLSALPLSTPLDLFGHTLLGTRTRQNAWPMWCLSVGLEWPGCACLEFEHYYYTLEAVAGGLGIGVAPWHLVADDIRAGRLVAPFGFHESGYRYVVKRRRQRSRKVDRFCAWLDSEAATMAAASP